MRRLIAKRVDIDQVGAVASFACAVHCAALPILFGLGAAGAVSWLDHRPVEWGFVGLAVVVGTVSAWRGYRKHGNAAVAVVLAVAALSLAAVTLMHAGHDHGPGAHAGQLKWLFPLLGLTIAVSHIVNRRLCNACSGCASHATDPAATGDVVH